jgi:hypothetical protein
LILALLWGTLVFCRYSSRLFALPASFSGLRLVAATRFFILACGLPVWSLEPVTPLKAIINLRFMGMAHFALLKFLLCLSGFGHFQHRFYMPACCLTEIQQVFTIDIGINWVKKRSFT